MNRAGVKATNFENDSDLILIEDLSAWLYLGLPSSSPGIRQ